MYQAPSGPQTIGQVLDQGFRLFKASFKSAWLLALIGAIAAIPWNMLAPATPEDLTPDALAGSAIAGLVYFLISLVIFGAICARIDGVAQQRPLAMGEAINIGVRRGPVLFLTGLLFALIATVGFLLLLIPGIWLVVALIFSMYIAVLERKNPLESLSYSWALVKGRWWRTALILTIVAIIASVLYLLLGFVLGVLLAAGATSDGAVPTSVYILEMVLMPLIQVVMVPLSYSLILALYYDAKLRREGSDLAERIAAD